MQQYVKVSAHTIIVVKAKEIESLIGAEDREIRFQCVQAWLWRPVSVGSDAGRWTNVGTMDKRADWM